MYKLYKIKCVLQIILLYTNSQSPLFLVFYWSIAYRMRVTKLVCLPLCSKELTLIYLDLGKAVCFVVPQCFSRVYKTYCFPRSQ